MTVLAVVGLGLLGLQSPGAALLDDPEIDTEADYRYVVDPETGVVDVTISLAVTADKPNSSTSTTVYQYFYEGYVLPIPAEAEQVTVTDDAGRDLSFTVDLSVDLVQLLQIDFRRNIFYRQTANVAVSYRLPRGDARTDATTRVNEAYAGFQIWTAPQLEQATISVVTPGGFVDRSIGSEPFVIQTEADQNTFVADDVDPETFWATVSLARDASLTSTDLDVASHQFRLKSWPGDSAWADHVTHNLEDGLPELIQAVGLDWPIDNHLTIIESYSPYLIGYAGWYDPSTDEIEIGDELDSHLVFHELSHVWFNRELFEHRWITEGLADEFAAAVAERLGEERPEPSPVSMLDSSSISLNRWDVIPVDDDTERWSYGASWTVAGAIVDAVGIDVVSETIQAAANDEISYLGDGDPEPGRDRNDWRLYLDLLENRGAITDDELTDLFGQWVLSDADIAALGPRAESRDRYWDLADSGADWAPPLNVRFTMSDWRYTRADELMVEASALLDDRDRIVGVLEPFADSLPPALEASYESANDGFAETSRLMADVGASAEQLRSTYDRLQQPRGVLQRIGSIGTDLDGDLVEATSEFEDGDHELASNDARRIDRDLDGLTGDGLLRLGLALAGLVTVVLIVWLFRRGGKRRRRRSTTEARDQEARMPGDDVDPRWAPPLDDARVGELG